MPSTCSTAVQLPDFGVTFSTLLLLSSLPIFLAVDFLATGVFSSGAILLTKLVGLALKAATHFLQQKRINLVWNRISCGCLMPLRDLPLSGQFFSA